MGQGNRVVLSFVVLGCPQSETGSWGILEPASPAFLLKLALCEGGGPLHCSSGWWQEGAADFGWRHLEGNVGGIWWPVCFVKMSSKPVLEGIPRVVLWLPGWGGGHQRGRIQKLHSGYCTRMGSG